MGTPDREKLKGLLLRMKSLACEYYELTRKPLGVTGEVAELEAAEKLGLELAVVRTPFYDGFRQTGVGAVWQSQNHEWRGSDTDCSL